MTPAESTDDLTPAERAAIDEEVRQLSIGTAAILPADGLRERLVAAKVAGRPLRVKLGIDPSGSELTLGHAVVLRKLRQFQDFGHLAVLIVGDFTGRVGDPTGRNETRKVLSAEDTLRNSAGYFDQLMRILREDRTEIRHNSEWLAELNFSDVLGYSRMLTVARLLERDDFSKRYKSGQAISLMEFMYPMMQGLDSVFIESDVELGGTDQTYNNLVGRTLQTQLGQPGQTVLTVPLLRGTDGADKMGKSLGNWIAISEEPNEQYGKIVAISDDLVAHYAELCCGWTAEEIAANATQFTTDPFGAKRSVAHRIVELYHGEEAAAGAADHFDRRFRQRELVTDDLQQFTLDAADPVDLITLLVDSGLCSSKGEARRMLAAGAVRVNGEKADPSSPTLPRAELSGAVLQRGKLNAVRLSA